MKKFTLVELITVIVVISIIAAIVMVSIQNVRDNAVRAEVSSNVRNFETIRDIKITKEQNDSLSQTKPTLGSPQRIDTETLYPDYIKNKPKNGIYWVDNIGQIYGSIVDLPIINQEEDKYSWEYIKNTDKMNVYQVTPSKKLKLVVTLKKSETSFEGESGEIYLFSFIDKLGLETAPIGKYEGNGLTCPIPLSNYRFTHNPEDLEEFHLSNHTEINNMFKTNEDNILYFDIERPEKKGNYSGQYVTVSLLSSEFETLKYKVFKLEPFWSNSDKLEVLYFDHLSNGDYISIVNVNERFNTIFRLDEDLNFIYGKELSEINEGYKRETKIIYTEKLNEEELLIAGYRGFNEPQLMLYDLTTGEIKKSELVPLLEDIEDKNMHDGLFEVVKLENGNYAAQLITIVEEEHFKRKFIYNSDFELVKQINEQGSNRSYSFDLRDKVVNYKGHIYYYEEDNDHKVKKYDYNLNLLETYDLSVNPDSVQYNNGVFYLYSYYGNKQFNLEEETLEDFQDNEEVVNLRFSIGDYSFIKYTNDDSPYYYEGILKLKNSTIQKLKSDTSFVLDVEDLELPDLFRHIPIDMYYAYDLLNPSLQFDLMTNYNQEPVNNGGNPYYPDGSTDFEIENVVNEITSLNDSYDYFEDYLNEPNSGNTSPIKDGFEESIIIMYMTTPFGDQWSFIRPSEQEGDELYGYEISRLTFNEYERTENIYLGYAEVAFDPQGNPEIKSKIYTIKGKTPSTVTVLGKEKLPFSTEENEENETEEDSSQKLYPYDVNPCYTGTFMFKADNTSVLYKVDIEGKLIPYAHMDHFINPIVNLYNGITSKSPFDSVKPINPYNDVILYYLPNGSIVDNLFTDYVDHM